MKLILSSENVVAFLKEHQLCPTDFQPVAPITCQEGTNFNLVVKSADKRHFLVKQSRVREGGEIGGLPVEWIVQKLIYSFANLATIRSIVSEIIFLDWSNGVLVSIFYDDYTPLDRYYQTPKDLNPKISFIFGSNIAKIHRATYKQQQQKEFLARCLQLDDSDKRPNFIRRLDNISLDIFSRICPDGLDFYRLYQRFPSFQQAIDELYQNIQPACLIHNDLTLDNLIIDTHIDLERDSAEIGSEHFKIIDWERIDWGDPAVDLGMVISEYVGGIWLGSLIAARHLDLNTMLRLAAFPLDAIAPSLRGLMRGYLSVFPEIISERPDFITRVVQFAGIGILNRLSYYVEHHYPFTNKSMCKLQVAKSLLCSPQQAIATIFGTTEAELIAENVCTI